MSIPDSSKEIINEEDDGYVNLSLTFVVESEELISLVQTIGSESCSSDEATQLSKRLIDIVNCSIWFFLFGTQI